MTGDLGGIIAPDKIVDKDAQVHGYEGLNKMTYALSVDPPEGNGSPVSLDMLQRFLKERRVVYGLDEEALQLLADGLYNKPLPGVLQYVMVWTAVLKNFFRGKLSRLSKRGKTVPSILKK